MFDADAIKRQTDEKRDWEARELADFMRRQPEARPAYRTGSGLPLQRLYTAEDLAGAPADSIGLPGR
jgi:methylmalonyl-CoA mutase N-terminal domain/subunit